MKQLVFATNNPNKVREIQALVPSNYKVLSMADMGIHEDILEDAPTLEGNAEKKACFLYDRLHCPCFADDTGLEVAALDNRPGVFTGRYAGCTGSAEECAQANMSKLLSELKDATDRSARFRTVIAYIDTDGTLSLFEGKVEGQIALQTCGNNGFGYDPIFMPNEANGRTFAQMDMNEKNTISHRGRALRNFLNALN